MIGGAALMVAGVAVVSWSSDLKSLVLIWGLVGFGFSLTQTPLGRIITRSTREHDRGAVFAGQFALSHACWLVSYPLAGWIGAQAGMVVAASVLATLGTIGLIAVWFLWPRHDPDEVLHSHANLPADHPHLAEHGPQHSHEYFIDDLHPIWPRPA